MLPFDLDIALQHTKADPGYEDELLARYFSAAVATAEGYCNRSFYADIGECSADFIAACGEFRTLAQQYDEWLEDADGNPELHNLAVNRYIIQRSQLFKRMYGTVADASVMGAIYMLLGHYYRNREVVDTPDGVRRILEPYLWIGDLAGSGS